MCDLMLPCPPGRLQERSPRSVLPTISAALPGTAIQTINRLRFHPGLDRRPYRRFRAGGGARLRLAQHLAAARRGDRRRDCVDGRGHPFQDADRRGKHHRRGAHGRLRVGLLGLRRDRIPRPASNRHPCSPQGNGGRRRTRSSCARGRQGGLSADGSEPGATRAQGSDHAASLLPRRWISGSARIKEI